MRSMALEFPEDPATAYLDKQYLLGDSLLVAPVLHESRASYYIPAGKWTNFWTGDVVEGPKFVAEEEYPMDQIPVIVRPNTVLLLGPEGVSVPDYEYSKVKLEARVYEVQEGTADVPLGKGDEIVATITVKDGKVDAKGMDVTLVQGSEGFH